MRTRRAKHGRRRSPAVVLLVVLPVIAALSAIVAAGVRSTEGYQVTQLDYQVKGQELAVTARVSNATAEAGQARVWYFIADPGDSKPWKRPVLKSRVVQRTIPAGESVTLSWRDPLAIPRGTFVLSAWVHIASDSGFSHAADRFGRARIEVKRAPGFVRTIGADPHLSLATAGVERTDKGTTAVTIVRNTGDRAEDVVVSWWATDLSGHRKQFKDVKLHVPAHGEAYPALHTRAKTKRMVVWIAVSRPSERFALDRIRLL